MPNEPPLGIHNGKVELLNDHNKDAELIDVCAMPTAWMALKGDGTNS